MHHIIQNGLEDFLSGRADAGFQAHLDQCAGCRGEVREMNDVCGLLTTLRVAEEIAPDPGFYARLSQNIDVEQKPSIWSIFSLDPAFGRRVAFASLMTLAILGTLLVSREPDVSSESPEAIMASHDGSAPHTPSQDRDLMMVTLASYRQ